MGKANKPMCQKGLYRRASDTVIGIPMPKDRLRVSFSMSDHLLSMTMGVMSGYTSKTKVVIRNLPESCLFDMVLLH